MTLNDTNPIDRIAMLVGTGLMLLGIVVAGIVEVLAGQPYGPAPLTNDAGDVIATPVIDPNVRTGLVLAGLAVLLLWAVYKLLRPVDGEPDAPAAEQPTT